jgi:ABC-type transport system substrate-binding protein
MCHVSTKDYQHYLVSLNSGYTWSDGVPVSLDDVFFTYNDILTDNNWAIPQLEQYTNVEVSNADDGQVLVTFPSASTDNTLFFTNFILPRHALFDTDLKSYQKLFAIEPVYNQCGRIMPQSTDPYSLVFDLSSCADSSL